MDKLDMIIGQLSRIEGDVTALRSENAKLHGRITDIAVNGCSLAPAHATLSAKVEMHEKKLNQAAGVIMAAGGFGGIVSWVLSVFGKGHS
jgi:hypothetical protein